MATTKAIRVSGFKLAGDSFQLPPDKESMTIDELRVKYNLPQTGVVYLLNGEAIGGSSAGNTPVRSGDHLEVTRAAKGGHANRE